MNDNIPDDFPGPPPRDVVRPRLTLEALERLNQWAADGKAKTLREPGELVENSDGDPVGIDPPTETEVHLATPVIHVDDVAPMPGFDRAAIIGGYRSAFPNLNFYDPDEESHD